MARRPFQLEMRAIVEAPVRPATEPPRTWGGKRAGAGRPRKPERQRTFVAHVARPVHKKRHPVHVTLRARKGLPSFRHQSVQKMLQRILERQPYRRYRDDFQVVHFSIQSNHLHVVVEATDKRTMRSGVSGLVIAFAKRLNQLLGSAPPFDGWRGPVVSLPTRAPWRPRRPRTWLFDEGWRIHGLLHPAELPAAAHVAGIR